MISRAIVPYTNMRIDPDTLRTRDRIVCMDQTAFRCLKMRHSQTIINASEGERSTSIIEGCSVESHYTVPAARDRYRLPVLQSLS